VTRTKATLVTGQNLLTCAHFCIHPISHGTERPFLFYIRTLENTCAGQHHEEHSVCSCALAFRYGFLSERNGGWCFFFLKRHLSRNPKPAGFFVCLFRFVFFQRGGITLAVRAVVQVVDNHQGFVAGTEEPWLGAGAVRSGARGVAGVRGTCAWSGRGPPRRSGSR